MAEARKKKKDKKPFNHVLEVQNGLIDVRDLIRHIEKGLSKEIKHGKDGT